MESNPLIIWTTHESFTDLPRALSRVETNWKL